MSHPLDYPIWTALTTRHAALAEGGALARRYPVDIAPFAALRDETPESWAALEALMAPGDQAVLFTPEPPRPPPQFEILMAAFCEQMIGTPSEATADAPEIALLGPDDVAEMRALVDLTKPGPFGPRTHELGAFFGIRIDGRLVAMTGERMTPGLCTEMTAVCVHPEFRGRGYAQALLAAVARGIVARDESPFLHVFADNEAAIALYRRQGMEIRRTLHVTVLGLAGHAQTAPLPHP